MRPAPMKPIRSRSSVCASATVPSTEDAAIAAAADPNHRPNALRDIFLLLMTAPRLARRAPRHDKPQGPVPPPRRGAGCLSARRALILLAARREARGT